MIPYISVTCSIALFIFVLALPWSNQIEGNHYQYSELRIQDDQHIFRSDGLTRIDNNHVIHLASIQDSSMKEPVVIRFAGKALSFNQYGFSVSGSLSLVSVQNLTPIMDDAVISPYLLLNNDPYSIDIDILYTGQDYIIIRERPDGRAKLLAKR